MEQRRFWYIDISGCSQQILDEWYPVTMIPVVDGAFDAEFDVLEDELPVDLCNRHRYETDAARSWIKGVGEDFPDGGLEAMDFLPIGVFSCSIEKIGARLIERKSC